MRGSFGGGGSEKKGNGSPPASSYHLVVLKLLLLPLLLETLLLLVHVSVIRHQALQNVHILPHGHFGRILHCLVPASSSAPRSQLTALGASTGARPTTVPLSVMLSGGGPPGGAAAVPATMPAVGRCAGPAHEGEGGGESRNTPLHRARMQSITPVAGRSAVQGGTQPRAVRPPGRRATRRTKGGR